MTPCELRLAEHGACLEIDWPDGTTDRLSALRLRAACQSSTALRRRLDGLETIADGLTIAAVEPIGRYAVNLAFSDGHARGIFPWALLRSLATTTADGQAAIN